MIAVDVYRDTRLMAHVYTDVEGKYAMSVPAGTPLTLRCDTHWSLTNAKTWHPSVVASIDAKQDIVLDRFLMRVGASDGEIASLDALTAYQFCAVWAATDPNREYADIAAFRVSQMKFSTDLLTEVQNKLEKFWLGLAQG
jgi:hypothetical protein